MTIYCLECNKEFEPIRSTARFCTPACRVAFNRRRDNQIAKAHAKMHRGGEFTAYNSDDEPTGRYLWRGGKLNLLIGGEL